MPRSTVGVLDRMSQRADAKLTRLTPLTVAERLAAFKQMHFHPWGLFYPDDPDQKADLIRRLRLLGDIENADIRNGHYYELQDETEEWETGGVPGSWNGQQAMSRSTARFRITAYGRRGGKSTHATHEAMAVVLMRPRSWCWLAAPINRLVSRTWDPFVQLVRDLDLEYETLRDSNQERLIVFENGARVEGISCENIMSMAGASINFAAVDEAAQIEGDVWERGILPTLTDTNGQALLISSYEGQGDFFHEKTITAHKRYLAEQAEGKVGRLTWELFEAPQWDNFYVFPQGRESQAILDNLEEMSEENFLEQSAAIPAGAREVVFPEFRERIHVGRFPYREELPVYLSIDPSSGINPYAIAVFQMDGKYTYLIDEIYETGKSIEQIIPIMEGREWHGGIKEIVVDSAWPADIRRLRDAGYPAFAVFNKPRVEERISIYRDLLRDPRQYFGFYRRKLNEILLERGLPADSDNRLPEWEQKELRIELEQGLTDHHLTEEDFQELRNCSSFFIDLHCVRAIIEHKTYRYQKRKTQTVDYKETPRKFSDHLCLAAGTPITNLRGYLPIEEIVAGDLVWTRNGWRAVEAVAQTDPSAEVFRVMLSNHGTLTGTPDHPIWIKNRGMTRIGDLTPGMEVLHRDGELPKPILVESVTPAGWSPVYNLTVEGEHEYFANGILVSNCDAIGYFVWMYRRHGIQKERGDYSYLVKGRIDGHEEVPTEEAEVEVRKPFSGGNHMRTMLRDLQSEGGGSYSYLEVT